MDLFPPVQTKIRRFSQKIAVDNLCLIYVWYIDVTTFGILMGTEDAQVENQVAPQNLDRKTAMERSLTQP